jgi:hypothetical protein
MSPKEKLIHTLSELGVRFFTRTEKPREDTHHEYLFFGEDSREDLSYLKRREHHFQFENDAIVAY